MDNDGFATIFTLSDLVAWLEGHPRRHQSTDTGCSCGWVSDRFCSYSEHFERVAIDELGESLASNDHDERGVLSWHESCERWTVACDRALVTATKRAVATLPWLRVALNLLYDLEGTVGSLMALEIRRLIDEGDLREGIYILVTHLISEKVMVTQSQYEALADLVAFAHVPVDRPIAVQVRRD